MTHGVTARAALGRRAGRGYCGWPTDTTAATTAAILCGQLLLRMLMMLLWRLQWLCLWRRLVSGDCG